MVQDTQVSKPGWAAKVSVILVLKGRRAYPHHASVQFRHTSGPHHGGQHQLSSESRTELVGGQTVPVGQASVPVRLVRANVCSALSQPGGWLRDPKRANGRDVLVDRRGLAQRVPTLSACTMRR